MKSSIRRRVLAVALLSVIMSAISLVALARIVSLSHNQRIERARTAVVREVEELRRQSAAGRAVPQGPAPLVGMRGGAVASPAAIEDPAIRLDPATRAALAGVLHVVEATGGLAVSDQDTGDSTLIAAALPAEGGRLVWVSYEVLPPPFVAFWRLIIASLTVATGLLVVIALRAVISVQQGAAALNASLAALETDLGASVSRPPLRELSEVSDGIAGLARALARAQIEKERLGAELARQDRLAALGRVAAGVAHEVRNPLTSIKLRVDLGRRRPSTPPELARELEGVSDEITRLDRLVGDLLIVAGRRSGPRQVTSLGPLVERRAGLLRPWAEERGVRIEVMGDATLVLDVDAIARAIDNLVRNAVEASPQGVAVMIVITSDAGTARVSVRDRGAGVDEARLPELFEPFFTTKAEGTGLGLALSRAIAAAHGGLLTYDRRGEVTAFELSFPQQTVVVRESAPAPERAPEIAPPNPPTSAPTSLGEREVRA